MRRLTVSTLRRQWGHMGNSVVPYIRLNGNWLANAGFTPGEKVAVEIDARNLAQPALIIRREADIIL